MYYGSNAFDGWVLVIRNLIFILPVSDIFKLPSCHRWSFRRPKVSCSTLDYLDFFWGFQSHGGTPSSLDIAGWWKSQRKMENWGFFWWIPIGNAPYLHPMGNSPQLLSFSRHGVELTTRLGKPELFRAVKLSKVSSSEDLANIGEWGENPWNNPTWSTLWLFGT